MKASAFFDAVRDLPLGTLDDLTGGEPFVVLSPHPDDESLGAGGLIAAAWARGQHAEVILVTDGAGSHPHSKTYPAERLIDLRRKELEQAGTALGLPAGRLTFLSLPDTRAPTSGALFDSAVVTMEGVIRQAGAKTVFATWKHDPHCDHEATAAMASALRSHDPSLRLWAYPIWGWHLEAGAVVDTSPPKGFRLDISPWLAVKRAAISAHRSQMSDLIDDDPDGFRFTPETLAPFLGSYEYFIEVPR